MSALSILERIERYNAGREAERLALKYEAMRKSAFAFMRGTCHLFHEDWRAQPVLDRTPRAWISGDLHLENFGSYKGDNRLAYFDLNDFDEATLAPVARDLARFLTSVFVGARSLGLKERATKDLAKDFLASYHATLGDGKARWVERQTANGMVQALLEEATMLTRKRLLTIRTKASGKSRLLRLGRRALPVSPADRKKVVRIIRQFAKSQPNPEFYSLMDVARRVAGSASLGLERYVLLVRGRGLPDKLALLDLKQAIPSSLKARGRSPNAWSSEASRITSIQRWAQAVSPALLHPVRAGGRSYVLRELQPTQNRLSLEAWDRTRGDLEGLMITLGQVVAWSHLRSGGRKGSAIADHWMAFADEGRWRPALLDYASSYSRQVERDWEEFVEATTP
ncbi:MAG TPA: DUF2252 family protein [Gemmatimonadales bacterium]|nr:DUF2252 family protein [Gemmatimonadales bacterium]